MNVVARSITLAIAGTFILAAGTPSNANVARPLAAQVAASIDNPATQVRWRGGGWGWGGAGLAAGAVIGAGIAASQPYYYGYGPYYYGPGYGGPTYYRPAAPPGDDAVAYCMQRYRSYDPESGTFLGYDGLRHPCP